MICFDICAWTEDNDGFCAIYAGQLALSVLSLAVNLLICMFAFSGDRFSPHTAMMRTILLADAMTSLAYLFDGSAALLQRNTDMPLGPPELLYVPISTCVLTRPHLFILQTARQWSAVLVMIMGIERYLFITYPLWFKVVRVRRLPILVFTSCFVTLSSCIAYTNALFVTPDEITHFTCELTWAFGENYGWCQSLIVIGPPTAAWFLNYYAFVVANNEKALLHFGNNRARMNSERRKIRKAMWIISAAVLFGVIPQTVLVLLRLLDRWDLQKWKLVSSELFLFKFVANFVLLSKLARIGPGLWAFTPKCCCTMRLRKARVDHTDSIASVSYYVNN